MCTGLTSFDAHEHEWECTGNSMGWYAYVLKRKLGTLWMVRQNHMCNNTADDNEESQLTGTSSESKLQFM